MQDHKEKIEVFTSLFQIYLFFLHKVQGIRSCCLLKVYHPEGNKQKQKKKKTKNWKNA